MLKPHRVAVGAEEGDATGVSGHSEGFEPFEDLLAVVEAWCQAVDTNVWVGDEFQGRPFASYFGVGAFDVAVDCKDF